MSTNPDASREQARQKNGEFGTQPVAEVEAILNGTFENAAITEARDTLNAADALLQAARKEAEVAALRYAALQVLDRHPDARFLVIAASEYDRGDSFVSHVEDENGDEVYDFTFSRGDDWARDVQVAVSDLPRGNADAAPSSEVASEDPRFLVDAYSVDIHDLFPAEPAAPKPPPSRRDQYAASRAAVLGTIEDYEKYPSMNARRALGSANTDLTGVLADSDVPDKLWNDLRKLRVHASSPDSEIDKLTKAMRDAIKYVDANPHVLPDGATP